MENGTNGGRPSAKNLLFIIARRSSSSRACGPSSSNRARQRKGAPEVVNHKISVIPGDGVGREVVPEGLKAVRAAADVTAAFDIETVDYPWSCEYYMKHRA